MKVPIYTVECNQVRYLECFRQWLERWKSLKPKKECLSRETFFCACQTASSMLNIVPFLLCVKKLDYLLLGKLNSDPIERRFGHYRQLAGANYFLSVRQFLEAEKVIRIKAIVKYTNRSWTQVATDLSSMDPLPTIQRDVQILDELLGNDSIDISQIDPHEASIVFYISGYTARKLMRVLKCASCVQHMTSGGDALIVPPVQFRGNMDVQSRPQQQFLDQINRGGLVKPSDLLFAFLLHAHQLHDKIFTSSEVKEYFLKTTHPREVFSNLLLKRLCADDYEGSFTFITCSNNHDLTDSFKLGAKTFGNLMLKNFVSEANDEVHDQRKRRGDPLNKNSKKVPKLQGN